jgi:hypothetical protein
MERIKSILQRLQERYYDKNDKTTIDIDLMLDYTRVLYADLLEWRRTVPEGIVIPLDIQLEAISKTEPVLESSDVMDQVNKNYVDEAHSQEELIMPTPATDSTEAIKASEPVAIENDTQEPADALLTEPEIEPIEIKKQEPSGISFEAPPPMVSETIILNNESIVEEESATISVAEEFEIVNIPLPEPLVIPAAVAAAMPVQSILDLPTTPAPVFEPKKLFKDIKTMIGINDKYLFLNELFHNNKSEYEHTLDSINQMQDYQEAEQWLSQQAAAQFRWNKEDSTVESFYALLGKYFSDK